jgi:prepilin-type N-terminal cleavage/methylation domain-containing protein
MRRRTLPGFTLVELLVVIAIIGVLVALLLPAIQMARESGRRNQCTNQMKQIALACIQHAEAQGFLPTGGWGGQWAGDPDQGYSPNQPGGWMFNILPYMDQQPLHDLGLNNNIAGRGTTQATPLPTFHCPTRRVAIAYPFNPVAPFLQPIPTVGSNFYNTRMAPNGSTTNQQGIGRSDYAANGGGICHTCYNPGLTGTTVPPMFVAPTNLQTGQSTWSAQTWKTNCMDADGITYINPNNPLTGTPIAGANGTMYVRSRVQMSQITDGPSKTYLFGERYINPDVYNTGTGCGDNGGWNMGYDFNTTRWASLETVYDPTGKDTKANGYVSINSSSYMYNGMPYAPLFLPLQDTAGKDYSTVTLNNGFLTNTPIVSGNYTSPLQSPYGTSGGTGSGAKPACDTNFGSAHPTTFNMAFCDGSIHAISYSIDFVTHVLLAQRADQNAIDASKWQASAAPPATTVLGSMAPH